VQERFQDIANGVPVVEVKEAPQNSKAATDWSSDGRFILYESQEPQTGSDPGSDLWSVDLKEPQKQFPLVQTEFEEVNGQFSPRWKVDWLRVERVWPIRDLRTTLSWSWAKNSSLSQGRRPGPLAPGTVRHCCISRSMIGSPKCPFDSVQADKWWSQDPRFHSSRRI